MFKKFSPFFRHFTKLCSYGLLSSLVAVLVVVAIPNATYGGSLIDILIKGVQVFQLSNLSDKQEMSLGSQINDELLKGNGVVLYKNTQVNQYIDTIGQKIAKNSGRPKLTYTFQVVDDNSINAFATMGGYVYLNTGLLKAAEDESEVASVLSHEIGHIVRRHAIKQMRSSAITQGVLSAAGLETSQAVQIGVDLALSKPNSRQDEYEADDTGLTMLRKTGYAPAGMVTFMRKLEQQQGSSSVPTFLSTHPATSERIKVLQKKIDITTANTGNGLDRQAYRNAIKPIF